MKFSIVTATYNSEEGIGHALASLAEQDYPRELVEWIVVDGNSTDRTLQVIKESSFQPDRLLSEKDDGIYDALNKGVRMATGDVIGFLHADDFLAAPDVLSRIACALRNSGADAVYGDLQYVRPLPSGDFGIVRHWKSGVYFSKNLKWGWMPPHPALYIRSEIYEQAAIKDGCYFDTCFSCAADYDFMMRILSKYGIEPAYLKKVLVKMQVGGTSNRSLKHIMRKSKEDWTVIRRNKIGGPHTLLWKNLGKVRQFFIHQ
ncbi:MAG: glycosyltransferase [Pontiellaceae bacterium]|nr:glycosyltransferase [Pontiellaceae bacterium]MBN2783998.1 glycosyltransferase [Pontiellaceae bacterium]